MLAVEAAAPVDLICLGLTEVDLVVVAAVAVVAVAAGTANVAKTATGKSYSSPSNRSLPWVGF